MFELFKRDLKTVSDPNKLPNSPLLGEYILHLFIIDTCKISTTCDLNASIEISTFDQKKCSRIITGLGPSSKTRWNEHFYFTKIFQSREDLENESIELTLFNNSPLLGRSKVGSFKNYIFDMSRDSHELTINKWAVFTDNENDFGIVKGFIRFSTSFSLSSIEQRDIEHLSFNATDLFIVDFPPSVQPVSIQLVVNVFKGRKIYGVESTGKSDPLVKASLGGLKAHTRPIHQSTDPVFFQSILIRYFEPTMTDRVVIRLYDHNKIMKNVKLGTIYLSLQDIKNNLFSVPKWVQFYGASRFSNKQEMRKLMVTQPDYSSVSTGEVLLSLSIAQDPKAVVNVVDIKNPEKLLKSFGMQRVVFLLQLEVEYVYNLDLNSGDIQISVDWGSNDSRHKIKTRQFQNKLLIVNGGLSVEQAFSVNFHSFDDAQMNDEIVAQVPDVFVYLTYNSINICFYRFTPKSILDHSHFDRTVKLKPDIAVSDIAADGAGSMKLKIGLREAPRSPEFTQFFKAYKKAEGNRKEVIKVEKMRKRNTSDVLIPNDAAESHDDNTVSKRKKREQLEKANRELNGNVGLMILSDKTLFPPSEPLMKYQSIFCFIQLFQAKELICVESDGLPDTFIDFYHFGSNICSALFPDSLNPTWTEFLILRSHRVNGFVPNLVVNLFDQNKTSFNQTRNELIGRVEIPLTEAEYVSDEQFIDEPVPKWHQLNVASGLAAGHVLLSVKWTLQSTLVHKKELFNFKSRPILVPKSHYHFKLTVVSIHDLKPNSFLSVRDSHLTLDQSPLTNVKNDQIRLKSRTSGPNPLFCQVVYSSITLSQDMHTIPSFQGKVTCSFNSYFGNELKVGDFVVDLFSFVYLSKIELVAKLEAISEHRSALARSQSSNPDHRSLIHSINEIVKYLMLNIQSIEIDVRLTMNDLFQKASSIRDDVQRKARLLLTTNFNSESNLALIEFENAAKNSSTRTIIPDHAPDNVVNISSVNDVNDIVENGDVIENGDIIDNGDVIEDADTIQNVTNHVNANDQTNVTQHTNVNDQTNATHSIKANDHKNATHGINVTNHTNANDHKNVTYGINANDHKNATHGINGVAVGVVPTEASKVTRAEVFVPKINSVQAGSVVHISDSKQHLDIPKMTSSSDLRVVLSYQEFMRLNVEDQKKYQELGFNAVRKSTLHYRLRWLDDLEDSPYMSISPFTSVSIYRGQQTIRPGKGFLDYLASRIAEQKTVTGVIQLKIDLIQHEVFDELSALRLSPLERHVLSIPKSIEEWKSDQLLRYLVQQVDLEIFVYIVDAKFSINLDAFSENDGFIVLRLNGREYKGAQVINDSNNPKFMERFVISCTMPDVSELVVEFWDEDLVSNEFIGATTIDVQRRFIDQRFRDSDDHPIETRELFTRNGAKAGSVGLWIDFYRKSTRPKEFLTLGNKPKSPWSIEPRPPLTLYIRIVVWEIVNVPIVDVTGAADLAVFVSFPAFNLQQKTDTSFRCEDGNACFNWRVEFEIVVDHNFNFNSAKINFRVFDKEILQKDKFLCDVEIDFQDLIRKVLLTDQEATMLGPLINDKRALSEIFFAKLVVDQGAKKIKKNKAGIVLSAEVLTKSARDSKPAGLGRSAPNDHPYLPQPTGRIMWSFNPVKIFNQAFGQNVRIQCWVICIAAVFFLVFIVFLPVLISVILSTLIFR